MPRTLVIQRLPVSEAAPQTLGYAIKYDDGRWKFFPCVHGHKPSKRYHKSLKSALPYWVNYPNNTHSHWESNVAVLIHSMVNRDWNLAALIYHWVESDEFEVRLAKIWSTGKEQLPEQPRFKRYMEATEHARDVLGL